MNKWVGSLCCLALLGKVTANDSLQRVLLLDSKSSSSRALGLLNGLLGTL